MASVHCKLPGVWARVLKAQVSVISSVLLALSDSDDRAITAVPQYHVHAYSFKQKFEGTDISFPHSISRGPVNSLKTCFS